MNTAAKAIRIVEKDIDSLIADFKKMAERVERCYLNGYDPADLKPDEVEIEIKDRSEVLYDLQCLIKVYKRHRGHFADAAKGEELIALTEKAVVEAAALLEEVKPAN